MQFSPNNETVKVSEYYTKRLNIKYMVQARQLRVDHPDFHYASALFRYEKEMAKPTYNCTYFHWINIQIYIENLVIKILIIMKLSMRNYAYYAV